MAYTFVAVTEIRSSTGSTCSNPVSATAGNALFCCAAAWIASSTSTTKLTPSGGGTWTVDADISPRTVDASDHYKVSISSCPSATGGSNTITVSNGNVNGVTAFIYEFSGNPTSSILDSTAPAGATGSSGTMTSPSETNGQADALFVAVGSSDSGANPATMTGTSSGWQYPAGGRETNGLTYQATGSGYKVVSSAGTESSSWTVNASSPWGALIACYKATVQDAPELRGRPMGLSGARQMQSLLAQ